MKKKNVILRTLVALFGLMLCGIGVGFFLHAGLGVDPASVFQLGIANVLNISYGNASALMNVIILAVVFFIDRHYINISSILAIFGIGYTADFTMRILETLVLPSLLLLQMILIVFGLFVMSAGIATYIRADLGVGAVDLVSEIISKRTGFQYRLVRVTTDILFVIIGYFLGGALGVGTIVAAFLTGPVVQFLRPFIIPIVDRIIKREPEGGKNA